MALNTVKKITRRNWDVIPIPDVVIALVNSLGTGQPKQLIFTNRHGRLIGNIKIQGVDSDADDDDKTPGVDPDLVVDDIKLPGVDAVVDAPQHIEINDLDVPANDSYPIQIEYVEDTVEPPDPQAGRANSTAPIRTPPNPNEGVCSKHVRLEIRFCSQSSGGEQRAISRCAHVYAARLLSS